MKNALLVTAAAILFCSSISSCGKQNGDNSTESTATNNQAPDSRVSKEEICNPFNVKDVPNPDGKDVQAFAAQAKLPGGAEDPNAEQWANTATAGKKDSLDGEWSSRWNGGSAEKEWKAGTATVKKVGDRVYILYQDRGNTYLINAQLQGESRLVGRYQNQGLESDAYPWVGKIVNDERIDGEWTKGRWDLRRKIAEQ